MVGKDKGRNGKGKKESGGDEAAHTAPATAIEAPGNQGSASSEDEESGSYGAISPRNGAKRLARFLEEMF